MAVSRSLVGFPSHVASATLAMISGAADADYPVANLADLKRIRRPLQTTGAGAIAVSAVLPAAQSVEFLALCHHNATAGATYRFRSYSDAAMTTLVDDSGTLTFPTVDDAAFKIVTPYVLPSPMTVRAVRVDLSDIGAAWQIGGLEIAGLIAWDAVTKREIGLQSAEQITRFPEGGTMGTRAFSPRVITSGREYRSYTADGFAILDLAKTMGRSEPFVWVRAYEDPASWNREAVLVRLRSLKGLTRKPAGLADFDLPLLEHLR